MDADPSAVEAWVWSVNRGHSAANRRNTLMRFKAHVIAALAVTALSGSLAPQALAADVARTPSPS